MQTTISFLEQYQNHLVKVAMLAILIAATIVSIKSFRSSLSKTALSNGYKENQTIRISKLGISLILAISIIVASNILGFGIQGIFIATSSFFAMVGIAFFATWSILSNLTSSIILYFLFPFRVGDKIEIEGNSNFSGTLKDVTLFYLRIETAANETITVPANIAIQRIIKSETGNYRQSRLVHDHHSAKS